MHRVDIEAALYHNGIEISSVEIAMDNALSHMEYDALKKRLDELREYRAKLVQELDLKR